MRNTRKNEIDEKMILWKFCVFRIFACFVLKNKSVNGYQYFNGVNPAFALTVRMKSCRRIFGGTFVCYCLVLIGLVISTAFFPPFFSGISSNEFFELGFLAATCCTVVFLGSDFGAVFIEATFQDELLRLTPMTPLQIVHGGICSSLLFSLGLLCPAFPVMFMAFFLQLPVERIFFGTLLLLMIGQALNLVLLSCYISARSWKEIALGAITTFLLIIMFAGFCFTKFGGQLLEPAHWRTPMAFLFAVTVLTIGIAYRLARCHAAARHRSFRTTVLINIAVYLPFLAAICAAVTFC